ncbi:MAG: class I SAM-dependent methyltransferase [Ilumatobacteraceae bacterium]
MPARPAPSDPTRFDDGYYRRFYGRDGAHDQARVDHLATAVHHMAAWWGIRIRTVLDVGAGIGFWRDWYRDQHPGVRVRSVDISEHACATWGHERRDIAEWRPPSRFDLVICHSVLQYLDDEQVVRAIDHLAGATRGLLYLELPTKSDLRDLVDPTGTDLEVHHRTGRWYRNHLGLHLRQVGAGLWVPRDGVAMYELEAAAP